MLLTCDPPRRRERTARPSRLAAVRQPASVRRLTRLTGLAGLTELAAVRWLAGLIGVSAMVLLPWTAYLAGTLPPSISVRHWPLVWSGLDGTIAIGLAATALLAIRRDRRIALVAVSTATLLLADAWFDVCTSPPGRSLALAMLDMGVEVAEAAACLLLAAVVFRHCSSGPRRYR